MTNFKATYRPRTHSVNTETYLLLVAVYLEMAFYPFQQDNHTAPPEVGICRPQACSLISIG